MTADMELTNKKFEQIVAEFFMRKWKLGVSLVFITKSVLFQKMLD